MKTFSGKATCRTNVIVFDGSSIGTRIRRYLVIRLYFSPRNHELVSLCFEPSQPQSNASGLNTKFTLSPCYLLRKSLSQKSLFLKPQLKNYIHSFGTQTHENETHFLEPIDIPWALNAGTCIQQGDLIYSAGLHLSLIHI